MSRATDQLLQAALEMLRQADSSLDYRAEFRAAESRLHSAVCAAAAEKRDQELAAAPVRLAFLPSPVTFQGAQQ